MTKKITTPNKTSKAKLSIVNNEVKRTNNIFDNDYIDFYTHNPRLGKTAALKAAGFAGENVRQKAYVMHNRLRKKIESALSEIRLENGAIGTDVIKEVALEGDTYAVRLNAGIKMCEFAGLKPSDKLEITEMQTMEEVDREIHNTLERISAKEKQELH